MTNEYLEYLKSNNWAQLKIDLFNLRGKKCEKCGSIKNICVHHLNYDNIFNEEPSDLIILCGLCHSKVHGLIKTKKKKVKKLSLAQKVALKKQKNKSKYITCCGYRWKK